ncbi:glutathione S-transferase family protein [Ramlibacter sp. AW1]|uniref:Glutathione S-transferase family protein n=1 Tax=Ramlibacter aurantiacus TaxID=2801330 RepID=A0A937D8A2_9BURK|nr:glutathione S-transferase family protein [Ramlibacter aurantiacus]MBL0421851.1 glutathione S-transferase family protein [Ramlibacter aurantiacus]
MSRPAGSLELYHFQDSVCSFKVRLCLAEKGLAWTEHHLDLLKFEHLQPAYLALNPAGVVPTLVHDGRPIVESSVINEYLDEVFPSPSLRPADAAQRADMRVWVKFEDDVLHPAVRPGTFNLMLKSVVRQMSPQALADMVAAHPKPEVAQDWLRVAQGPVDEDAMAAARAKLDAALAKMERRLARHPWLAGEDYSLADIALVPMLDRMVFLGLSAVWQDKPGVSAWFERVQARPAFGVAAPRPEQRMVNATACVA